MSQFFYRETRKVKEGEEEKEHILWHSFNVDKVIRTLQVGDTLLVLLDDGHEESIVVGKEKNGQDKKERKWFDSQIYLESPDRIRYIKESRSFYNTPELLELVGYDKDQAFGEDIPSPVFKEATAENNHG